jgi:hypothetical protein
VQAPDTKPDASAIPNNQLDPIALTIAEGVRRSVAGRTPQQLLNSKRQPVNPHSHINRLDRQPNLLWCDHRNSSRSHSAQDVDCDTGQLTEINIWLRWISILISPDGAVSGMATVIGTKPGAVDSALLNGR